jgi:enamine deaminase RidA (YjgF/YER057c/UK114 family)
MGGGTMGNGDGSSTEALCPVELGRGRVRFAQGIRAGRWVFVTGCMAQNFSDGIAPDVLRERAPHSGAPKREKEAALIFDHIDRVLRAGGTELANLVRTDQYYTTVKAVPPYQTVRRRVLGRLIPPSTSITESRFVLPGADMNVQAIAAVPGTGFVVEHLFDEKLRTRESSGYSPALTVGDFVFLPGILAMARDGEPARNGVAAAALMPEGAQWGGQPIKLETEFVITQRIAPSLALAGASLKDVAKAQVYLTDPDDYSAFNEVWVGHFGDSGPALSVIPCAARGLAIADGRIEINVIAVRPGGTTIRQNIDAGVATSLRGQPQAVRAGDLLFLSGLMADDGNGLVDRAATDPRQPWFSDGAEAQAEHIIDKAEALCAAAGTALSNVVRLQMFFTDIAAFHPVYRAWERRTNGAPLPFAAVEVPGPLPAPDATVLMDIWVHAP